MANYDIIDGPSKDSMLDAFKHAYDKTYPYYVHFTLRGKAQLVVQVTSLEHESGDGMSIIFKGNVVDANNVKSNMDHKRVEGWFHTGTKRHGWLQFV